MADNREKYFWLLLAIATSLLSFHYFSLQATITFFLSGLIVSSKCLIEDFMKFQEDDEKQNEKNH